MQAHDLPAVFALDRQAFGADRSLFLAHRLRLFPQVCHVMTEEGRLETNHTAVELLRSLGFALREDSPWRMALGPSGDLGASPQCLAVGGAANG